MFAYDPRALRYRDDRTGRFLPHSTVTEFMESGVETSSDHMATLASWVKSGTISPADWAVRMRTEIKQEAIRQAILGAGGREQMDAAAWGRVGSFIAKQYHHLDGKPDSFLDAVEHGDLSEAAIAARAKLYSNACRETYEKEFRHRLTDAPAAGVESIYDECRWIVTPGAEHCPDCLALAALGWMPIASLHQTPGDGSTQCMSNCRCRVEYRNSKTAMSYSQIEPEPTEPLVSLPYYPDADHTDYALESGQHYLEDAWAFTGKRAGGVERLEEQVLNQMHAAIDGKGPSIRANGSDALSILQDGRFKSQFESGHSNGYFKLEARTRAELNGMGAPDDLPHNQRPIYGYYPIPGPQLASAYGKIEFALKPQVSARTTITLGDSLEAMGRGTSIAVPSSQPSKACFVDEYEVRGMALSGHPDSYLEAQIHEGVTTKDVGKVIIHIDPGNFFYRDLLDEIEATAKQKGIEVEYGDIEY